MHYGQVKAASGRNVLACALTDSFIFHKQRLEFLISKFAPLRIFCCHYFCGMQPWQVLDYYVSLSSTPWGTPVVFTNSEITKENCLINLYYLDWLNTVYLRRPNSFELICKFPAEQFSSLLCCPLNFM